MQFGYLVNCLLVIENAKSYFLRIMKKKIECYLLQFLNGTLRVSVICFFFCFFFLQGSIIFL